MIKAKVISFERDAEFFYRLSQKCMERGDMAEGIRYLRKAANSAKNDSSYAVELAKALSAVSQYDQSNLIYLKLLANGIKESKCCFGLSQNLYFLNDLEHSYYYLNLFMDKYAGGYVDEDEEEYIEIIEEGEGQGGFNIVYPPEKRDMGDVIGNALSHMRGGMLAKAEALFETVPEGNPDYLYARNHMALCKFFLNDFAGVEEYCGQVLALDPDNVFALCTLCSMYNFIQDSPQTKYYLDKILSIKTDDLTDLFKIATTLCEVKEHDLGLKYLKRLLAQKPYDINIMFLTAIGYYNTGDLKASVNTFLEILKLNDRNYAAKFYLNLINRIAREGDIEKGFFQPLEYVCQVPYGEMLTRVKYVKELTAYKVRQLVDEPRFWELCDWCFTLDDFRLHSALIKKLSAVMNGKITDFFKEKLIDPQIKTRVKELIIERFMLKGVSPPYDISVDYIVRKLSPIIEKPKKEEKSIYQAYSLAYVKLLTFVSDKYFERDIYRSYRDVLQKAKDKPGLGSRPLLAAVVAYGIGKPSARIKKHLCKLFGVDQKSFNALLKELEE